MTPHEAVYGKPPPVVSSYIPDRMKYFADKHRTEREFQPGDRVYLRLRPYRQATMRNPQHPKLAPRFYGPFRCPLPSWHGRIQAAASGPSRIHNVFHVSLLKKKAGFECLPFSHSSSHDRWPSSLGCRHRF
ncbi:unnamed protein product [Prunus brigantina]